MSFSSRVRDFKKGQEPWSFSPVTHFLIQSYAFIEGEIFLFLAHQVVVSPLLNDFITARLKLHSEAYGHTLEGKLRVQLRAVRRAWAQSTKSLTGCVTLDKFHPYPLGLQFPHPQIGSWTTWSSGSFPAESFVPKVVVTAASCRRGAGL
jgi:hypothetical protein